MDSKNVKNARSASRLVSAFLLGVTLLLGAGAAATAVFSQQTQQTAEDFTQRLMQPVNEKGAGYVKLRQFSYEKGFMNSTQTLALTFATKPYAQPSDSDEVLIINHIQHGPFPGFQSAGKALVNTEFRFADPKKQATYDALFPR